LPVQQIGLVTPLFDCLDGRRYQHRMSADQLQILDVPSLSMTAFSTNPLEIRPLWRSLGKMVPLLRSSKPLVIPCEMRIRWGTTGWQLGYVRKVGSSVDNTPDHSPGFGHREFRPVRRQPRHHPRGGGASSLIICTFAGILVGVRSCPPDSRSLSICFMILATCWAAGGGGGGGGGATRNVNNCDLGSSA